jgi:uncharacterized protein (DUF1778 family)
MATTAQTEAKRDSMAGAMLSRQEHSVLRKMAAEQGQTVSDYLRSLILEKAAGFLIRRGG